MVAEITEIQENEADRPVTTFRQVSRNNKFNQSQTSKLTDPITNRTCPHQQASPQNTEKQYAILPTVHLHTGNQRYPTSHIHLPKIHSRKISAHSEDWQENFSTPKLFADKNIIPHMLTYLNKIG